MDIFAIIGFVIIILYFVYLRGAKAIRRDEIREQHQKEQDKTNTKRWREVSKSTLLSSFKEWHKKLQDKDQLISCFEQELQNPRQLSLVKFFCNEAIKHAALDSRDERLKKLEIIAYRQRSNTFDWITSRMKSRYEYAIGMEKLSSAENGTPWILKEKSPNEEHRDDILQIISTFEKWKADVKKEEERKQKEEHKRIREQYQKEAKAEAQRIELERINREREERQKRARKVFSKDDLEYNSNGDYTIDGEDYMSIWTYKIRRGISPNSNSTNGDDSKLLLRQGARTFKSIPDKGNFPNVQLFKVEDLNEFYS